MFYRRYYIFLYTFLVSMLATERVATGRCWMSTWICTVYFVLCMHVAYPAVCKDFMKSPGCIAATKTKSTLVPRKQILHKTCISNRTFSWGAIFRSLKNFSGCQSTLMILNACFGRKLFKNVCDCVMFEGNTGMLLFFQQ